eukprot:jgi/Chlat1/143/Chrsp1S03096
MGPLAMPTSAAALATLALPQQVSSSRRHRTTVQPLSTARPALKSSSSSVPNQTRRRQSVLVHASATEQNSEKPSTSDAAPAAKSEGSQQQPQQPAFEQAKPKSPFDSASAPKPRPAFTAKPKSPFGDMPSKSFGDAASGRLPVNFGESTAIGGGGMAKKTMKSIFENEAEAMSAENKPFWALIGRNELLLVLSFVMITGVMLGTVWVVYKLGGIHFNE